MSQPLNRIQVVLKETEHCHRSIIEIDDMVVD